MTELKQLSSSKCFGGQQELYEHASKELGCQMKFGLFVPSAANEANAKLAVVYFLSGITSTEQDFITKSGFQRYAEENQLVLVSPDTSPRGCNIAGENDHWDLGTGAGFYVDAIQEPWKRNYRMYSYVTSELRQLVETSFDFVDAERVGISGHSMGGHGALVAFLRNGHIYKAVSAMAPIANPSKSARGIKCFTNYLGNEQAAWSQYDATELVKRQPRLNAKILIDQGAKDERISILTPHNLVAACKEVGQPLEYNERDGYDHGFYFLSTFIESHLRHLAQELRKQ